MLEGGRERKKKAKRRMQLDSRDFFSFVLHRHANVAETPSSRLVCTPHRSMCFARFSPPREDKDGRLRGTIRDGEGAKREEASERGSSNESPLYSSSSYGRRESVNSIGD